MSKTAFERYAPFIQEYIYRKKWTDLREVQVEACEAIMDTDQHVIIASGTASGKTEAAFFPILTLLEQRPSESIGVMYIGPLKALINDQFERLNELLDDSEIPVWPWHGDVSQSVKRRALKTARGILQITPESLEALLMRHPGDARRLFSDLQFIVIDEIHALMGVDRGLQVLCLIARLEKMTGCNPRRIGLSATLNDYQPAMDFLASGSKRGAVAVGIQSHKRTISLCVENFSIPKEEEKAGLVLKEYHHFLYDNCHQKKCLIFTNSRRDAEEIIANMKGIAAERSERDVFYVHHGSVSASLRQEAEHALRDNAGPTVAAATLTLELGIDIGDLDSTIQLGAPYTCSSFVQRLGRSGRRTGKSQMMFVNLHEASMKNPLDALPWGLLRSIAIIQLYLEERWVEPFAQKKKPFSLLAHQTLSTLMTYGELSPAELARSTLLLPAFRDTVLADEYRELLRYMLQEEYLQRMDNGGIIIGLKGEKITNHYSFYAVFQDEEMYRVMTKEGEIGTLTNCPAVEEVFVLAGRAWKVVSIDEARKIIYVSKAHNTRIPSWSGGGGDIHARVVQRMKQVLLEDTIYPYLRPNAQKLLSEARKLARESGLLKSDILPCGNTSFFLCPWTGTREIRTIGKLLSCGLKEHLDIFSVANSYHYLQVTSDLGVEECIHRFHELEIDCNDPDMVLPKDQTPKVDKYDPMV
ncbi:MAG: DEAD/DEAH box helicase, partial [Faecousia sp.]